MKQLRSRQTLGLRHRQGGAIIVFAAIGISLIVILLSAINIGVLYYYKREYQKAADLAAMAGARSLISANGNVSCGNAQSAAQSGALSNLAGKVYNSPIAVSCGKWNPAAAIVFDTSALGTQLNGVRAIVSGSPPRFLPFTPTLTLTAQATAIVDQPVAALSLRSTLATVDSTQSALLNGIVGGLLGGSINLPVASWDGLLNTNINLLKYLDALALQLGVSAGNYDQVLNTNVTLGQLLNAGVSALNAGGGTGQVSAALGGLGQLANLNLPAFTPLLRLGDLLKIQTGTPASGLDTNLNLLNLVQGSVQLANSKCAACVSLPINVPGIVGAVVRVGVIEPPQPSSIGNPALAVQAPLGENRIYVRSAQVRALVSLDLPLSGTVLNQVQALLNDTVISGVTNTVNDLLSLNLIGLLQNLSCILVCDIQRDIVDIQVLPSPRIDLNLDAGSGQAYVNAYDCSNTKSLTVPAQSAAAVLRIGNMGTSAANAATQAFSSSAPPTVNPVPLIDIGTRRVRTTCILGILLGLTCVNTWQKADGSWTNDKSASQRKAYAGGGIGLKANVPVAGSNQTLNYLTPPTTGLPDIGQDPAMQTLTSTNNIIGSLKGTLTGIQLQMYPPSGSSIGTNGLGNVLVLVGSVVNTLVSTLTGLISNVLSLVLDPLLNALLAGLGIELNKVTVGANMTCNGAGATLVD